MSLAHIRAENFRQFSSLSLRPHRRLNLILGANAAGKTSLLEVLYTLGRAKSFRGNSPAELAGAHAEHWWVSCKQETDDQPAHTLGVKWVAGETQIRYDQAYAATADLVRVLPVQILEPGMHRLLQDGPSYRRSFLDWGVFHVEHSFHDTWRRYQRALRQRNQALRRRASAREVSVWDIELTTAGVELARLRREHLNQLEPGVGAMIKKLLSVQGWSLELQPGWHAGASLQERLSSQLDRDRRAGMTVEGPHRAELRIRLGDHPVKNRISRGQQKLLIAALLLAQCQLILTHTGKPPVLLVDDFPAELAEPFQVALLAALREYPGQVFISAFEQTGPLKRLQEAALFHVEQGRVTPAQC